MRAIWELNDELTARGAYVCPTNCSCDQLSACGQPYIKSPPPQEGWVVSMQICEDGNDTQRWLVTSEGNIALASNMSLCIHVPGKEVYPLVLGACSVADRFIRSELSSTIVHESSQLCLDLESSGLLGTWTCGDHQPNQAWAYDAVEERLLSLMRYPDRASNFAGECVTTSPPSLRQ